VDPRLYAPLRELERTHWWFRGRRRILLAALARARVRAASLLDVGCGAGTHLELLAERFPGARCVGIDVERAPLRFCRDDGGHRVCQADAARLPFASGSFELVTALDALEHVEDDAAALRECFRVLRPGGALLASVPAFRSLWGSVDELGHHHRRYRRSELLARVEAAGFEVVLDRYFNFLLFPPIAAVRWFGRMRRGKAAQRPRSEPQASEAHRAEPVRSDFDLVAGGPLGALLAGVLGAEARLLALRAPFGVSLLCVARRPPAGARASAPGMRETAALARETR
jgi:ubiquinone/menaquinone biosynthesis C-methylase UbiE